MSARFELLREFSKKIEDDHLDEDQTEVEVHDGDSTTTYQQRTVTLRGRYNGTPMVLMHEAYHFTGGPPKYHDVFDVFTADPEVVYEGTIRPATWWTKVRRWFGRGGLVGDHPVYATYEFEFPIGPGKGSEPTAFEHELHAHLQRACYELVFQSGAGISGLYAASPYAATTNLAALLDRQIRLWKAITR